MSKTSQTSNNGRVLKGFNKSLVAFCQRDLSAWLLMIPSIILFFFVIWRPIIIGVAYSFFKLRGFTPVEFVGLKNYIDVMSDTNFITVLFNSVKYVLWAIVIGFPLPFIVAIMLNEMVHFKGFFKVSVYLPVVVPAIATYMIWYYLYLPGDAGVFNLILGKFGIEPFDWLQNKKAVIPLLIISSTWHGFGSQTLVYLAGLQGINTELYEACKIDGGGFFTRIRVVVFPFMKGTLLLLLIRLMINIFQILEMPLVMTGGGPNGASVSMGLQSYKYAFEYAQMDKSMAMGVITFLILICLTFVYAKAEKNK